MNLSELRTNMIEDAANRLIELDVVIEIPAQSPPVKYEADKATGMLRVDRILPTGMRYPCNYGFVPGTHAKDGDPLDTLVLAPFPLAPLSVIRCRLLGMLRMTDEHGSDAKLLTVPSDQVNLGTRHLRRLEDVPAGELEQIAFFFEHYKKMEPGKWVRLDGWAGYEAARQELSDALPTGRA